MKKRIQRLFAITALGVSLTTTHSAADDYQPVYPQYQEDETLVFRSGIVKYVDDLFIEEKDAYGVKQYRIPDLTKLPDGRLVATIVCRCSRSGDHSKSTSFFAVSEDEGKTWNKITFNTDYENMVARPATDFPMTERTQETQVVWYPAIKKFVAIYLTKSRVWFVTSADLKTWSKPVQAAINVPDAKGYWPSPTSLQIDQDGSLMFAITGSQKSDGSSFARLIWTKDLKGFEVSPSMPVKGNETAVVAISGGKYFVSTRISPQRINMTYERKSQRWSEALPFPAPHHWRCEVDLVNDGKFLYMATPLTRSRTQGRLYRSHDEGKSWKEVAKLSGDDHFGYSSLVVLKNGDIGILAERARLKSKTTPVNADIVFKRIKIDQ
ncbi:exo-alpha-sialidase [Verrucomicrobiaceae bacterium N1E253]|uniref:exo-alpha-sialidase n=1 Tax=Oceaniferula marina TaxID=2748318 RepID=A0A851GEM2_9BACT|nr:sialidase family protein [Oceaniferula marina]NWK55629.1 exo-alpha-sialidase [Oceaniferula marina]